MTPEQIQKLPKWAQHEVKSLIRQREFATEQLAKFINENQEGSFIVEEMSCHTSPPSFIKKHIKSDNMRIEHGGVILKIYLRKSGDFETIDCQYRSRSDGHFDINFIPTSHQSFSLHYSGK